MRFFFSGRGRQILVTLLAGLGFAMAALFLLAWSGVYNIAASSGHVRVVEWFLAFGMRNSVELRARMVEPPPPLDDPDLFILGAGHYDGGCSPCHGAPGVKSNPISQFMLPPPPDLADVTKWNDRELFWIILHGIKYTGMPAWAAQRRTDEVWAVVAFLRRLPKLEPHAYHELVSGKIGAALSSGELLTSMTSSDQLERCIRCHGSDGQRPASRRVPLLHGQPVEYLTKQLEAFQTGRRESGIMQPIAAALSAEAVPRLAGFYARLRPPPPSSDHADADLIQKGAEIATQGSADNRLPPCLSCHGPDALAIYPRLHGQHADYMAGRLRRWKNGILSGTETETIMAPIAKLLQEEQIEQASAYFESLAATSLSPAKQP
jgi:cytochrome c553